MKNNIVVLALTYCKHHKKTMLLFATLIAIIFMVFFLYGLPIAPAIYISLLLIACMGILGIISFRAYCIKLITISQLKLQAETFLGELPIPSNKLESEYNSLVRILDRQRLVAVQKREQDALRASQYYTLWSHQIKTPLAAMRLLLQESIIDKDAIDQELFKTEQYVDMVLQYQRLESHENDLLLQKFELSALVKKAIKKVANLFIKKKIALELEEFSAEIVTDEKWFIFILEQILTNAVKYTNSGKVLITYKINSTSGAGPKSSTCGILSIADTGIGIREQDLPRIFDWGFTGYNGRENSRSTGIGLALCKQAATLLGLELAAKSQVLVGTTISIKLQQNNLRE